MNSISHTPCPISRVRRLRAPRGQVLLAVVIFFLGTTLALLLGFAEPMLRSLNSINDLKLSSQSYYAAESLAEDLTYRLNAGITATNGEILTVGNATATSTITSVLGGKTVTATGTYNNLERAIKISLSLGTGVAFRYAMQVGEGGIAMFNSSSVTGNIYSAGSIVGVGSNMVYGSAVSAGSEGLVYGIHATSSVYAHTIGSAAAATRIDQNAYYATTIANTTVSGTSYPGSADQPTTPLPISDSQIAAWESAAAAGGTISSCDSHGDYTVNASTALGPIKINCNLVIKTSSGVLDVTGPIWVVGNITTQTGPTIKMDASLGSENVAIIADNPSNESGSGIITIGQSTVFQGSGAAGSNVFMITQNNSAQLDGSTVALSLNQGASALVAYAAHGLVSLSQSAAVKDVTAYQLNLSQSANVTYDTGLPSTIFESGPSGGYTITGWSEQKP